MASSVPAAPQSRVPEEVPIQHEQQEQVVEGMVGGGRRVWSEDIVGKEGVRAWMGKEGLRHGGGEGGCGRV